MELMSCQDMAVPMEVMHHVVRVESSYNPFAIGVVGGHLVRQPRNLPEALATVRMLESRGYNFSLGLAQVNRHNLAKYGIDSYEKAFQACPNLQAGSRILAECYGRSGGNWGKSFSCYYSGDFATGFRHGYVQKVYASIRNGSPRQAVVAPDRLAIRVVDQPARPAAGSEGAGAIDRKAIANAAQNELTRTSRLAAAALSASPVAQPDLQQQPQQVQPTEFEVASQAPLPQRAGPVILQSNTAAPVQPAVGIEPQVAKMSQQRPGAGVATNLQSQAVDNAFVF
jgi:type IV secretion system protein VirB1